VRYRLERFSVERLMAFIAGLRADRRYRPNNRSTSASRSIPW
jgi:hypothetical protein